MAIIKGQGKLKPVPLQWFLDTSTQQVAVSFSSATTDGADVASGNISVLVANSSATTDGADVASITAEPLVSSNVNVTDGSDILASNVSINSNVVSISSAWTDGVDILSSNVGVNVDLISSVTNGSDVLASSIDSGASEERTGAPPYKPTKRHVISVDGQLMAFRAKEDAIAFLESQSEKQEAPKPAKKSSKQKIVVEAKPVAEVTIDIAELKQMAEARNELAQIQNQLRRQQYEALIKIYESWIDEEEIELLLMVA